MLCQQNRDKRHEINPDLISGKNMSQNQKVNQVGTKIKAIKTEVVTEKWDSSFLDTSITIEKCNLGTKLFYIKKFANHHCKTLLPIPDLMFKIFISGI